jgi:hypothetical protein
MVKPDYFAEFRRSHYQDAGNLGNQGTSKDRHCKVVGFFADEIVPDDFPNAGTGNKPPMRRFPKLGQYNLFPLFQSLPMSRGTKLHRRRSTKTEGLLILFHGFPMFPVKAKISQKTLQQMFLSTRDRRSFPTVSGGKSKPLNPTREPKAGRLSFCGTAAFGTVHADWRPCWTLRTRSGRSRPISSRSSKPGVTS